MNITARPTYLSFINAELQKIDNFDQSLAYL